MKFYHLKCEVPGGLGVETIYDKHIIPWKLKYPHIVFDGWMGGEILIVSSCLLVTERLAKKLLFEFTGIVEYSSLYVEKSDTFNVVQTGLILPKFRWMKVGDKPFIDDIALTKYNEHYNQLIISDRLWKTISDVALGNYSIALAVKKENHF